MVIFKNATDVNSRRYTKYNNRMNSENFMYLWLTLLFGLTIAILHKDTYLLIYYWSGMYKQTSG